MSDFLSKFTNLFSDRVSQPAKPRRRSRKPPTNRRLHLEPLEERTMLCAGLCPIENPAPFSWNDLTPETRITPQSIEESAPLPEFSDSAPRYTEAVLDFVFFLEEMEIVDEQGA